MRIYVNASTMSGPSSGPTAADSHLSAPPSSTLNLGSLSQHLSTKSYESRGVSGSTQGEVGSKRDSGMSHSADSEREENYFGGSLRSQNGGGSYRRHLPRNSGGFLLESASAPTAHIQDLHPRPQGAENPRVAQKDNRKDVAIADSGESRRGKQHHRHRRYHASPSLGSSPLSREVTPAKHHYGENETSDNPNDVPRLDSDEAHAPSTATVAGRPVGEKLQGQGKTILNQQQNTAGLDTDTLQIVNIALNLSESRRKGAGATRSNVGNILNARRTGSAGYPNLPDGPSYGPLVGGSLKQHLQQQRRISRNISPTPDRSMHVATSPNLLKRKSSYPIQAAASLREEQEYIYSFSKSTLARAEKARVSLELLAEYMRLLQFLPPLKASSNGSGNPYSTAPNSPITNESRNQLSRLTSRSSTSGVVGRPYNPLQCIRNRKVRARERRSIDAVTEGWTNLENVRSWVSSVESVSSNSSFQSGERVILPQFPGRIQDNATAQQSSSQIGWPDRKSTVGTKPKRPRADWQISPSELLADAFWLELEDSKKAIEDSHGNKLYTYDPNVIQRSSVIEHEHAAADSVTRLQRIGDGEREYCPPGSSIKMPSFTAQLEHDRDAGSERGRRRRKIHKLYRHHDDSAQSGRNSLGWRRDDALLNDSSGASSDVESSRGRRIYRGRDSGNVAGSQTLEKLRRDAGESELSGTDAQRFTDAADTLGAANGSAPSDQGNPPGPSRYLMASPIAASQSQESLQRSRSVSVGISQGNDPKTSFDRQDFVPSIAMNLSPPQSRTTSPVRNPIVKAGAKIGLFRTERGKERENAEGDPERIDSGERHHKQISVETDHRGGGERSDLSPTRKLFSRTAGENTGKEAQRHDNKLSRNDRDGRETESSGRAGGLKSGRKARRIEEIFRSEVSKVGDLIWKKEGPTNNSVLSSSATSSYDDSSDSDGNSPPRGRKKKNAARLSLNNSDDEDQLMAAKGSHFRRPEYHSANLPTFTLSPGRRERIRVDAGTFPEADHITRQQVAQREVRKPSRFLQYAPPKIDIDSLPRLSRETTRDSDITRPMDSLDYSDADSRRDSYGFGGVLGGTADVRDASGRFNAVLGAPVGSKLGPPVTGLTALDASNHRYSSGRPSGSERQQQWSISDQEVAAAPNCPVTRREIARITVLLLSSGVKAQQISNRAKEVRKLSTSLVLDKPGLSVPRVLRSEEHILAAQIYSADMQRTSHLFNEAANRFRRTTASDLHSQITAIREHISMELSPLVREAGDDADSFSTELSTTHTLAVKQLNDNVDTMIRRRKRRLRMLRRLGYVLLEWTLLVVMWWVWLVVVTARMIRITVSGLVKGVRWLLWL
ncbi:hypothetical protein FGG08_006003 [Glutinoglossum americanum]|uniref:Uncharacterized protein n=1 Tax=Glutinoglossum americanum TaxID=1670608 RepID=A0A9P8L1A9_9PEZI|nr:hypothetical protein FGG08_006003 [Glutinoglossum americanum]